MPPTPEAAAPDSSRTPFVGLAVLVGLAALLRAVAWTDLRAAVAQGYRTADQLQRGQRGRDPQSRESQLCDHVVDPSLACVSCTWCCSISCNSRGT